MILIELKLVRLLLNVRHLGSITLETTTTLASDMIWYQHCSHIEEEDLLWWCSGGNGTTSGHQPNPFVLLLAVPLQQHLLQLVDMDTTNRGIFVGCNLKSHQKLGPSFSTVCTTVCCWKKRLFMRFWLVCHIFRGFGGNAVSQIKGLLNWFFGFEDFDD